MSEEITDITKGRRHVGCEFYVDFLYGPCHSPILAKWKMRLEWEHHTPEIEQGWLHVCDEHDHELRRETGYQEEPDHG